MMLKGGLLLGVAIFVITILFVFGTANALPIKWGRNLTEVNTFSDDLIVSGWQRYDYDNGLKFTGNPNLRGKSFSFEYNGTDPAYFAVYQTKNTKKGAVTKERWGEVYYNKKNQLKVRWFKNPLNLNLGNPVIAAVDETSPQVETWPIPAINPPSVQDKGEYESNEPIAGELSAGIIGPGNGGIALDPNPPANGTTPTPEPASMLLYGTGLACYGLYRMKFKKN